MNQYLLEIEFYKLHYKTNSEIKSILIYKLPKNKYMIYQFFRMNNNYNMVLLNRIPNISELSFNLNQKY